MCETDYASKEKHSQEETDLLSLTALENRGIQSMEWEGSALTREEHRMTQ